LSAFIPAYKAGHSADFPVNYPAAAAGPEGLWPGGSCGVFWHIFIKDFSLISPSPEGML